MIKAPRDRMTAEQRVVLDELMKSGKKWSDPTLTRAQQEAVDACIRQGAWDRKHENTDYIVCPYCLDEDREVFDYPGSLDRDGDETETECAACERTFKVTLHVNYTYTTAVPEEEEESDV